MGRWRRGSYGCGCGYGHRRSGLCSLLVSHRHCDPGIRTRLPVFLKLLACCCFTPFSFAPTPTPSPPTSPSPRTCTSIPNTLNAPTHRVTHHASSVSEFEFSPQFDQRSGGGGGEGEVGAREYERQGWGVPPYRRPSSSVLL